MGPPNNSETSGLEVISLSLSLSPSFVLIVDCETSRGGFTIGLSPKIYSFVLERIDFPLADAFFSNCLNGMIFGSFDVAVEVVLKIEKRVVVGFECDLLVSSSVTEEEL
mmetsp:Transcript_13356/g.13421  ORF Transcript_13356/g.13421 Transcript_13356/m.13421 type:complete len:109 (+) Transcript_13356:1502-1828(+)